jgi:20S proteasome alpha/beta subunit
MTLAAGFVASDGILLCTDTLVSDGYTKQHRKKIFTWKGNGISVAFAVAGDATIAIMAAENCCIELEALNWNKQSFAEVYASCASTIRYIQHEYVDKVPAEERERSRFYMLIAIYTENSGHRLYVTNNAALSAVHEFECIGSARSLGIYILEPSYKRSLSISQISVMALHAFAAAKERCDGVGGSSQFLALRLGETSTVGEFNLDHAEKDILWYRHLCATFLSDIADRSLDDSLFQGKIDAFVDEVKWMRANWDKPAAVFKYMNEWLAKQEAKQALQSTTTAPLPPPPSPGSP